MLYIVAAFRSFQDKVKTMSLSYLSPWWEGGGGVILARSRFERIEEKDVIVAYILMHPFRTLPGNFGYRSSQIRSLDIISLSDITSTKICDCADTIKAI